MAFTKQNLKIGRGEFNRNDSEFTLATHTYKSDDDAFGVMIVAGYFPDALNASAIEVKIGDLLQLQDLTKEERLFVITALSPLTVTADSGNLKQDSISISTTLTGPYGSPIPIELDLRKIGDIVVAHFQGAAATATSGTFITLTGGIPSLYFPKTALGNYNALAMVEDNAIFVTGLLNVTTTGVVTLYKDVTFGNFTGVGLTGIQTGAVSWIAN